MSESDYQRIVEYVKMVETAGEDAWLIMMPNFRRLCDLADGKTTEPSKYDDQE